MLAASHAGAHYILDAIGLTRIESAGGKKPKLKSVCPVDLATATLHGHGAWSSFSVSPDGARALISRGGYAATATVAVVDLKKLAMVGTPYRRDLRGIAGAAWYDDAHVVLFVLGGEALTLQVHTYDAERPGGLGECVAKLPCQGPALEVPWSVPLDAYQRGDVLPTFVRMAPDGGWLCVEQSVKKAWSGKLVQRAPAWELTHTFELPLRCSARTWIEGYCDTERSALALFDTATGIADLLVVPLASPADRRHWHCRTSEPVVFGEGAAYALATEGGSLTRWSLADGTSRSIDCLDRGGGEVCVVGEQVLANSHDRSFFVDVSRGERVDRKIPSKAVTVYRIATQDGVFANRHERFSEAGTEETFRRLGYRARLAAYVLWPPAARSRERFYALGYDTFHDASLVGLWLDTWVKNQRSLRSYTLDGHDVRFAGDVSRNVAFALADRNFDAETVHAALDRFREHSIRLDDVLCGADWLIDDGSYRPKKRPVFAAVATRVLLATWCTAAEQGSLDIPPREVRGTATWDRLQSATPRLLDLLFEPPDETGTRSVNAGPAFQHFVACVRNVIPSARFEEWLRALHGACKPRTEREHLEFIALSSGIKLSEPPRQPVSVTLQDPGLRAAIAMCATTEELEYSDAWQEHDPSSYKPIHDVSGIQQLTELRTLRLVGQRFTDPRPIFALPKLEVLDLSDNGRLQHLDGIESLNNLRELSLDQVNVIDLTPLRGLTALQNVSLRDTRARDLSPLESLPALKRLRFSSSAVELDAPETKAIIDRLRARGVEISI